MSEEVRTSNPSLQQRATVGSTGGEVAAGTGFDALSARVGLDSRTSEPEPAGPLFGTEDLSPTSQEEVARLLGSAARRKTTPVRKAFVRTDDPGKTPPLAQIVSTRGRGGAVPLKVYLALLRRSSSPPFDTRLSARRWASLLDLDSPNERGARRVNDATRRLEDLGLIRVEAARGEASVITILCEDGSGDRYTLPSTPPSRSRRSRQRTTRSNEGLYLQVPDRLWQGYIQQMSGPALTMLLILLAEPASKDEGMWWSVEKFPDWYKISSSMRAKGTRELVALGLVQVRKKMLDTPRGHNDDERDRVRNLYTLTGPALSDPTATDS